ncbi:hypothetical protein H105_00667 [Trichophyton soudanense CBS 452.61]|uniref:Aminoglycoside phosphotransferase domain-containing protein n=1 Tax=Trichophyton soudanense CBS 452.61 TaxID=1215331 RepID=A0A022Y6N1_TRISD|nr:hypothetical protein H105_00667 [Trichophyton soudanense CBS 452.61]EZG05743.1 hypothetical protein H106_04759 [Trichophyton rubrum CBS 735.88]
MSPWIGNTFDNYTLKCPDGSKWRIIEKISEKSVEFHAYSNSGELYAEAQAVYLCRQAKGSHVGMEAIVKVRMQVPSKHSSKPYAQGLAYPTATEISTLQYFTENGCSVVPRLFHCLVYSQDPNMPIPGGYMAILIMEKCPGVVLSDFWNFEESKKKKIRKAFLRDFSEFQSYPIDAADPALRNIIYDEVENKCWFIDHEQTFIFEEREIEPYKADRRDLEEWDLEKYKRIDFQTSMNGTAEATWD